MFRDLEPYSCTFKTCQHSKATFVRRRDWVAHELQAYCSVLLLPLEISHGKFAGPVALKDHVSQCHNDQLSPEQMSRLMPACRTIIAPNDLQKACALCQKTLPSERAVLDHIAIHMEEIALFALPRSTCFDYDTLNGSESESSCSNSLLITSEVNQPEALVLPRAEEVVPGVQSDEIDASDLQHRVDATSYHQGAEVPTKSNPFTPSNPLSVAERIPSSQLRGHKDHHKRHASHYWSVQEKDLFLLLFKKYGADWTSIAQEMEHKSETMIKSYYRKISL